MNDKHNRAYKVTYTSPQSQNEFLSILGLEVKEKIAKDIKGAGVFSRCLWVTGQRSIPYIPCQGQRSNTVNEHACEASPIVSELFETLQATYSFFSGSTKRYAVLHDELQNVENSLMKT